MWRHFIILFFVFASCLITSTTCIQPADSNNHAVHVMCPERKKNATSELLVSGHVRELIENKCNKTTLRNNLSIEVRKEAVDGTPILLCRDKIKLNSDGSLRLLIPLFMSRDTRDRKVSQVILELCDVAACSTKVVQLGEETTRPIKNSIKSNTDEILVAHPLHVRSPTSYRLLTDWCLISRRTATPDSRYATYKSISSHADDINKKKAKNGAPVENQSSSNLYLSLSRTQSQDAQTFEDPRVQSSASDMKQYNTESLTEHNNQNKPSKYQHKTLRNLSLEHGNNANIYNATEYENHSHTIAKRSRINANPLYLHRSPSNSERDLMHSGYQNKDFDDSVTSWKKRSKRSLSTGTPAGRNTATKPNKNKIKERSWDDVGMGWMKRDENKRNWDDVGMGWMKRDEEKRNWDDVGMGWMKRDSEKRNWDDVGMGWMKRNEEKRNWDDVGMGWMKRNLEKRNWDDVGMGWMKRNEEKRNWDDVGMGWMKRDKQ